MSTLFTYQADFRAQKIIVAAQYSNTKLNIDTNLDSKKLKGKSALGTAPVLETAEGTITQSNAIARYVAGDKLFGKSAFETAQINQWVDYCLNNVEVASTVLIYPILGLMKNIPEVSSKAASDLKKACMILNNHLKANTFMVGERISFADVALACALVLPFKFYYTEKERKAFPCVIRWFTTLVNQPEFKKVVGEVTLCKKRVAAPASAAPAPAAKKEKKKAAAPKAAAPAPAAPAKKAKNPLDLLPKSKLNLDTWKKTYSNSPADDFYKCMPWFWENFDAEGWSIYTCKYNYNEENKVGFMVANLVGGFVQRCDEIRKYAFGTMQVIGTEGELIEIVGAWLFRGQSEKIILDCNPDAEYYTWEKVDTTNEEQRKLVGDLWCADETLMGKPIMDAKVFK